jgi:Holliday junction DNA helicase RuvA
MYEFLKGHLIEVTPLHAVLDVSGVGYKLWIPISTFGKTPSLGTKVLFYTSFVVRENFQGLYGFLEKEERDLFEVLIALSGIGPKTGLNLIGHLSLSDFQSAVFTENSKTFSKVPGIGKKTAERLIIDLKGKVLKGSGTQSEKLPSQKISDAVGALMQLGYNATLAESAIKKAMQELPEEADLSSLISTALKGR